MSGCRIKLVSNQKFQTLKIKYDLNHPALVSKKPWLLDNMVRLQNWAYTEGIYDCTAGGIQNGKRVTLFHLDPLELNRRTRANQCEKEQIRQALKEDIFQLKKEGPVRGLLVDGRVEYDSSLTLYYRLHSMLSGGGAKKLSRIWGRQSERLNGPTHLMYNADKNTWYLNAQLMHQNNKDILTLKELRNAFHTVELASGDTLVTAEKTYTAADLSGNPFRQLWELLRPKEKPSNAPGKRPVQNAEPVSRLLQVG